MRSRTWSRGVFFAVLLLGGGGALAQTDDEEPTPPGQRRGKPAGGQPGPAKGAPAAPGSPGAAPAPAVSPAGAEPSEPRPTEAKVAASARPKRDVLYGAGLHLRGIFVPEWFLNAFLDSSTGLSSVSLGGEFVRRKGNFDLVATINFGFYSPPDGTYLGNGKNPAYDADYVQFRDLNVLTFDVSFLWHHDFTKWLSLVYGAGLGLGIVLGDIYRISNFQGNCTPENLKNLSQCNPVRPGNYDDLAQWNNNRDAWLNANTRNGPDTPQAPHLYREEGKWPVIPMVHLLIGLNFKINEQISVRVDGGFHDAFYVGAGSHYFF